MSGIFVDVDVRSDENRKRAMREYTAFAATSFRHPVFAASKGERRPNEGMCAAFMSRSCWHYTLPR